MNNLEEEWGEERLIVTTNLDSGLSAAQMPQHALEAVDAFVSGAMHHDDMTLVISVLFRSDEPGVRQKPTYIAFASRSK